LDSGLADYLAVHLSHMTGLDRYIISDGFDSYVKYQKFAYKSEDTISLVLINQLI